MSLILPKRLYGITAELLEESGVQRKGLVGQERSVRELRSSTGAWIGMLHCQLRLVDPSGCCVPGLQICVCRSSEGHGGDLTLDVQFESAVTLYKCLGKISDILHLNNENNQLER